MERPECRNSARSAWYEDAIDVLGTDCYPQDLRPTTDADIRSVVRYSDEELLRGCQRLRDILRPEGVDIHDVRIRELNVGLSEPVKRLQVQATVGGMRGNTNVDVSSGYWGKDAWASSTKSLIHTSTKRLEAA
jgi:hypothetical protein